MSSPKFQYCVVDVFTGTALKGNPVAVVLDGSSLSTEQMQQIANWTNLSETTFVIPTKSSEADYGVRIFAPTSELPFAGHPSLGTAFALVEYGLVNDSKGELIQECARGLIKIKINKVNGDRKLFFGIDGLESSPVDRKEVVDCLAGLDIKGQPLLVNSGPRWIVAEATNSAEDLLSYQPNHHGIREVSSKLSATGICIFAPANEQDDIHLRTFAPLVGVNEDPVCGSGNAAVAYYRGQNSGYTCYQGSAVRRDGTVSIYHKDLKIWVGGSCRLVVDGKLSI